MSRGTHTVGVPLDPQDVGVGVLPGQLNFRSPALGAVRCALSGRVHSVWSQSGPKSSRDEGAPRPPRWQLVS